FALESQRRWAAAETAGRFGAEITAVELPVRKGPPRKFDVDEHPRPEATLQELSALKPAFRKAEGKTTGTVTAGNSSGLNDGAAVLLLASEAGLRRLGAAPLARVVASAAAGVEPRLMGLGPIP